MADTVYESGDVQGGDYAFDAAGKHIDWSPVVDKARGKTVRLSLSLGMLFTQTGRDAEQDARLTVRIDKGATEQDVKRAVYASIRRYIRLVSERIYRAEQGYEDEDEGEDLGDADTDFYAGIPGSVALLSAVSMR